MPAPRRHRRKFPPARIAVIASAAVFCLLACDKAAVEPGARPLASGFWQATITLPGGDIETGIEISTAGGEYRASLVNGQERVRIGEVSFSDGELRLRFPAFNNEIRAVLDNGELNGELTIVRRFGKTEVMPFRAIHGGARPKENSAPASHDLSGRWAVRFHEPDGTDTASIGEFAQRGSRLFGTFLNPNGDHRFLAGHVRGNRFKLSTFDGAHAFIFSGTVNDAGAIENADFWSSTSWHQTWSAVRDPNVVLADAFSRTFLRPGYEKLEFEFPDTDGRIVSLADEKYAGKVVILTLAGTWCPNCNDEARFMAPFYKAHRDRGLEVIALMFEHFDDFDLAAEQVREFRDKFNIEYDTVIAGISDKTEAARVMPALSAFLAFPTTIFIDRSGRVRSIHTGFSGPGTGEHYTRLQQQFTDLVTNLLAEPVDLAESLASERTPVE
jgi:peroxiredoxin